MLQEGRGVMFWMKPVSELQLLLEELSVKVDHLLYLVSGLA